MNKAFVREPEDVGRAYCPRCGSLGTPVGEEPLDTHIRPEARGKLQDAAWFCSFPRCEVAYFNQLESVVTVDELTGPIYPKDAEAPICACFDFTYDDIEADVREGTPRRTRELLGKAKSAEARCATAAADGHSCIAAVQQLYMKLQNKTP